MQLKMQKENQERLNKLNSTDEFQRNQAKLQSYHNAQMEQYEGFAKKRNQ